MVFFKAYKMLDIPEFGLILHSLSIKKKKKSKPYLFYVLVTLYISF